MSDLVVEVDASEARSAAYQAESAASSAESAAANANTAAAAAAGAALTLGQLGGQAMEYAREDAQRAAAVAQESAAASEEAAATAIENNTVTMEMILDLEARILKLENVEPEEPAPSLEPSSADGVVQTIPPQGESMQEEENTPSPAPPITRKKRKARHGR